MVYCALFVKQNSLKCSFSLKSVGLNWYMLNRFMYRTVFVTSQTYCSSSLITLTCCCWLRELSCSSGRAGPDWTPSRVSSGWASARTPSWRWNHPASSRDWPRGWGSLGAGSWPPERSGREGLAPDLQVQKEFTAIRSHPSAVYGIKCF